MVGKGGLLAVLAVAATAIAGCSGTTSSTNPESGLSAREETCLESNYMTTEKECINMTPAEKEKAEHYAHVKQVEGEAKEAETIIKKRQAERNANAAEGAAE
jgi:hypothetical protein